MLILHMSSRPNPVCLSCSQTQYPLTLRQVVQERLSGSGRWDFVETFLKVQINHVHLFYSLFNPCSIFSECIRWDRVDMEKLFLQVHAQVFFKCDDGFCVYTLSGQMGCEVILLIVSIYYPALAAIGVPVNLVAIVILSRGKCGLSKCITVYLVGMAVSDLLVIVTDPILNYIVLIYFTDSFLSITPVCSLVAVLLNAATVVSVWFTVAFTFDRFVAICCEKLKTKYCTKKTATVVVGTVSVLGCLESLSIYFIYEPKYIIDNVPMKCTFKRSFLTSPTWATLELSHYILTPCVPFFLILLLNVLTVRRILFSNKVRRAFRSHSNGENHKDPEMENRRKSIILLFSISGSFILLWMIRVVFNLIRRIADMQFFSTGINPNGITDHTSRMLQLLSSCTNTCIYAVTQTKFRQELKNAVKCPLNIIVKLVKS
ncbi:probable G-protein coupled receptor 139 [Heterodontus francisci]|uniref:probable G-protein coupled receptor 139 n=1 Tax=Heterodontus francisci TaxID=7792 RepID=UPI00355C4B2B